MTKDHKSTWETMLEVWVVDRKEHDNMMEWSETTRVWAIWYGIAVLI